MSNKFNKKLSKYVELVLKLGVNIQKGQFLFISASNEEVELIKRVRHKRHQSNR